MGCALDKLTPKERSKNMAAVKSKDTEPEMFVRRSLHALGFRFRLHRKDLPGKPDLVFPSRRAVVLVHGCFWHGHTCRGGALPATRREFWEDKIGKNRLRDKRNVDLLLKLGWRVLTVWECELRDEDAISRIAAWLNQSREPKLNMLPDSTSTDT